MHNIIACCFRGSSLRRLSYHPSLEYNYWEDDTFPSQESLKGTGLNLQPWHSTQDSADYLLWRIFIWPGPCLSDAQEQTRICRRPKAWRLYVICNFWIESELDWGIISLVQSTELSYIFKNNCMDNQSKWLLY